MRIRKRMLLSSLSDPQLNPSPVVVQPTGLLLHSIPHGNHVQRGITDSQPSDLPNQRRFSDHKTMIAGEKYGKRSSSDPITHHNLDINQTEGGQLVKEETYRDEQENGSNYSRKEESFLLAAAMAATTEILPPSSSHQLPVDERWVDGDKAIPLKKRRGSFPGRMDQDTLTLEKEKNMKCKTNKKCSLQENRGEYFDKQMIMNESSSRNVNTVKKMNKRGSVILEGSRCSRVNGRGWRCCQQTLVGYSLCEHHLGKGRLRSKTSVRSRAMAPPITTKIAPHKDTKSELQKVCVSSSSVVQSAQNEKILLDESSDGEEDEDDDDDYNDSEEKKPVSVKKKKRMKLGVVKARSLSSLLNQTNSAVGVEGECNINK